MKKIITEKLGKNKKPILVILVGESGVGKTTFVKKMKNIENWFESSCAIVNELKEKGEEVNHDTIHKLATEKYQENPYWQVPKILSELSKRNFLVLDGPRRIKEVKALLEKNPRTIIVRIVIPENETRSKRLNKRDKTKPKDFKRIIEDETRETELNQIISLSDLEISNDKEINDIEKTALEFKKIIINCLT